MIARLSWRSDWWLLLGWHHDGLYHESGINFGEVCASGLLFWNSIYGLGSECWMPLLGGNFGFWVKKFNRVLATPSYTHFHLHLSSLTFVSLSSHFCLSILTLIFGEFSTRFGGFRLVPSVPAMVLHFPATLVVQILSIILPLSLSGLKLQPSCYALSLYSIFGVGLYTLLSGIDNYDIYSKCYASVVNVYGKLMQISKK